MARKSAAEIRQMIRARMPGAQGEVFVKIFDALNTDITALESSVTANGTSITNLNAWGTALATKLNADAGVTDTNYDTTPQS